MKTYLQEMLDILEWAKSDPEAAHGEADKLLCQLLMSLGEPEIVKAWEQIPKYYS